MGANQSAISKNRRRHISNENNNDKSANSHNAPNQIKFSQAQLMKLKIIQSYFGFDEDSNKNINAADSNSINETIMNTDDAHVRQNNTHYFNSDEAFMSTVSTLIAALNNYNIKISREQQHEGERGGEGENLLEIIKLFTCVFIKNINLIRVSELLEFSIENQKIVEHLLKAYIKALIQINYDDDHDHDLKDELLRSLLILCSSKIPYKKDNSEMATSADSGNDFEIIIIRYFHINLLAIVDSYTCNDRTLCSSLIENIKLIPIKAQSYFSITATSVTNINSNNLILSDPSKISLQLLLILFFYDLDSDSDCGNIDEIEDMELKNENFCNVLEQISDSKIFTTVMRIHAHYLISSNLNLNSNLNSIFGSNTYSCRLTNITQLILFQSLFLNFCPNYRRFLLSKLDNDDYLLSTCRTMYQLMKSPSNRRTLILMNLYLLAQILLSLTEDETFLQQVFDSDLDRSKIKWFEGWNEFDNHHLGAFIFCLLLDLLGANLASKDGFKDEHLHQLLIGILCNMAQYAKFIDNRLLSERFFALLQLLFNQRQRQQSESESDNININDVNRCIVDVLSVMTNILINSPKTNSFLISQVITDAPRLLPFLRDYLRWIDSKTNCKESAHLREEELEFTAVIVGILKFLEKLQRYLEQRPQCNNGSLQVLESILETFPVPTIKRDCRGEAQRLGLRIKLDRLRGGGSEVHFKDWSKFCSIQGWPIIYSTIPWNNYFVD